MNACAIGWCTRTDPHTRLHTAVIHTGAPGAPSTQQVELAQAGAGRATHIVLSTPRGSVRRGRPALLTPTAARASARAAQRAGDPTLAAALTRAADLAESGGAR